MATAGRVDDLIGAQSQRSTQNDKNGFLRGGGVTRALSAFFWLGVMMRLRCRYQCGRTFGFLYRGDPIYSGSPSG